MPQSLIQFPLPVAGNAEPYLAAIPRLLIQKGFWVVVIQAKSQAKSRANTPGLFP